jgi:hypothetical protein
MRGKRFYLALLGHASFVADFVAVKCAQLYFGRGASRGPPPANRTHAGDPAAPGRGSFGGGRDALPSADRGP